MRTQPRTVVALASMLILGLPATMRGQASPTPPPESPENSENPVVALSAFTVSADKDVGYLAVDSLSGGRLATPLRVTPAPVSTLTGQFLNDLSLTDIQSSLKWSLNAVPTDFRNGISGASGGEVFNFWSVSIRGDSHVQGGNPPTKNYFPTFMMIDTYNIDRIETDSGPNSILFGIGDIGGAIAAYTKTPQFGRNFSRLYVNTSNYGGYRTTIDVNAGLDSHLALRINALLSNEQGWKDGDRHKKKGLDLAATYRFSDNTQIRFEAEGWREQKSVFAQSITDGVSLWDQQTNAATWGATPANSGVNPLTTPGTPGVTAMNAWGGPAHYLVWSPSVGLFNWAGGTRSMGTGDVGGGAFLRPSSFTFGPTGTTIMALPSKEFAVTPADSVLKPEAVSATLNFEQRVSENCEFVVSGYRYVDDAKAWNFEGAGGGLGTGVNVDLNQQLPNGQANPNYGKRYSDFFLDRQTQNHRVSEVRGQINYHFNTHLWGIPLNQLFSASAGEQVTNYDARQYMAQDRANYDPNNWTQTMIWGRVYWDQPQRALALPTTAGSDPIVYTPLPFNWYDFNSKQTIKYFGAFSQTRLWNDRLNLSMGIRHDTYDNWKVGLRGTTNVPTIASGSGNTYSVGVVGYLTDWFGLVANLSENYQPAAGGLAPTIFGQTVGPSFGHGRNAGIRISTTDRKYYVSAIWYRDNSSDVIGGDSPDFQGIWNDYFAAGGTNTDIGPAGNVTGGPGTLHANMSYVDTYSVKYTGFEFEAVANPTKNIRLQVHYSVPRGETTNDAPNATAYLAQHLSTWQAVASAGTPEAAKVADDLTRAQEKLASVQAPTITAHLVKSIFNVFGTYAFTSGALEGFEIGGGATMLDKQYGNTQDIINGQRTLSPGYTTYSMLLAYARAFHYEGRKLQARVQLNVDNLFGSDTLVFISYQKYGDNLSQPMDYNMVPPRKLTLSASVEF